MPKKLGEPIVKSLVRRPAPSAEPDKFDRVAYQREYMRKRRAAQKEKAGD